MASNVALPLSAPRPVRRRRKLGRRRQSLARTYQQRAGRQRRRRMGFVSGGNGEALRLCHYRPRARRGGGGSLGGGGNDKGRLCHHRLHQDVPTEGWALEDEEDGRSAMDLGGGGDG